MTILHKEYRPRTWEEVVGQAAVVKSMRKAVDDRRSQCFLLCGPSGVGKTTMARIAARAFGCDSSTIRDIDAATFTGIDAMRAVQEATRYVPFGKSKALAIVVDEAHGLSRQAWDSLLKATEEPPPHVIWFFCTTNVGKVPKTMQTRCLRFDLKSVSDKDLLKLLDEVCDAEKIDPPADVADLIIKHADGSPRLLLQNLAICCNVKSKKEAAELLKSAIESDVTLEFCRLLAGKQQPSWGKIMAVVEKLAAASENPEGVRIQAMNYFGSALRKAKTDNEAIFFLQRVEAFSQPYNGSEGLTPLLRSIGQVIFAG